MFVTIFLHLQMLVPATAEDLKKNGQICIVTRTEEVQNVSETGVSGGSEY